MPLTIISVRNRRFRKNGEDDEMNKKRRPKRIP